MCDRRRRDEPRGMVILDNGTDIVFAQPAEPFIGAGSEATAADDSVLRAALRSLGHQYDPRDVARVAAELAPIPAGDLRGRLTETLTREHYRRARAQVAASPEEHSAAMADAVMVAVPELAELERLRAELHRQRRHAARAEAERDALRAGMVRDPDAFWTAVHDKIRTRAERAEADLAARDAEIERLRARVEQLAQYELAMFREAVRASEIHEETGGACRTESTLAYLSATLSGEKRKRQRAEAELQRWRRGITTAYQEAKTTSHPAPLTRDLEHASAMSRLTTLGQLMQRLGIPTPDSDA